MHGSGRLKVVGLMRLHVGIMPELVIGELARHVDAMYFWVHEPHERPETIEVVRRHPKTVRTETGNMPWNSELTFRAAWAMLEDVRPDWVIYPDDDELLPPQTTHLLEVAQHNNLRCVQFPFLVCQNNSAEEVIKAVNIINMAPHCRIARWRPLCEVFTTQTYPGYDYLCEDDMKSCLHSPWPVRHLLVVNQDMLRYRMTKRPHYDEYMTKPQKTTPFAPERAWREWFAQQKEG